jgi:predicted GIY-YIG superfamily endonuclease
MPKKKDTRVYALKNNGKTVYIGVTNNFDRRKNEHRSDGKKFDEIIPMTNPMSRESALKREAESIKNHQKAHKGKKPKHNK